MNAEEKVLSGGRITAGVVRIGDTVRRPGKPSSSFSARLLTHLAAVGFTGAPRFLGRDDQHRDMLSFIPGWVPARFQRFHDEQVWAAGQLLQRFHAATANSTFVDGRQVVCHHDPGPNNVVFQEGRPTAFIDFDMAAPGEPLEDLGYMAWTWCISSRPDRGPLDFQAQQVRVLVDAYGLTSSARSGVMGATLRQQELNIQFWSAYLVEEARQCVTTVEDVQEKIEWTRKEIAYTRANQTLFEWAIR